MNIDKIKTPNELLKYMNNMDYGFVSNGIKYLYDEVDNNMDKYHLLSVDNIITYNCGICFDQVELERYWFSNNNMKIKTYFIIVELPYQNPYHVHTYLVYEDNNKYYYFENADFNNKGIYEFNDINELISFQKSKFIETNNSLGLTPNEIESIHIYEYDKPNDNLNFIEFINYILENGKKIN